MGGVLNVIVCAPTTKKDADCVEAGAKMVLPGCEAITMQVPGAMRVRVLPDTVQAEELIDSNCTVKPEVAVAASAAVVPALWFPGEAKVMDCVAWATVKVLVTVGAAVCVLSPACEATMVQVPAETRVKAVSVTVQTAGVLELNCTGKPELLDPESNGEGVPKV